MSIDFESKEGRETYLNEKLDNLLSGMDKVYGQVLLEELITRLQRTLEDFNDSDSLTSKVPLNLPSKSDENVTSVWDHSDSLAE